MTNTWGSMTTQRPAELAALAREVSRMPANATSEHSYGILSRTFRMIYPDEGHWPRDWTEIFRSRRCDILLHLLPAGHKVEIASASIQSWVDYISQSDAARQRPMSWYVALKAETLPHKPLQPEYLPMPPAEGSGNTLEAALLCLLLRIAMKGAADPGEMVPRVEGDPP